MTDKPMPAGKQPGDYGQAPASGHPSPQDGVAHHEKAHAVAKGAIDSHKPNDYNAPTTSHEVGHPSTEHGQKTGTSHAAKHGTGAPKAGMQRGGEGNKGGY
jgi:hypothetical protein